jgi:hypothetical protein
MISSGDDMELLLEIIGEFILEILMEAKNNKHIPFIIRIFMILILTLFYIGIAFLFLIIGINAIKTNIFLGLLSILISLFLGTLFLLSLFQRKK